MDSKLCSVCGIGFSSQLKLSQHKKNHDNREFNCEICGENFMGKQKFLDHNINHDKFTCTNCGKELSKGSKSKHMKNCLNTYETFEFQFQVLREKYGLSETLKIHVITSHFSQYFEK